MRAGGADSQDSCEPTSTGWVYYWWNPHGGGGYVRSGPELHYGGNAVAFARFNLAPIPHGSIVRAAQFRWYQYEVTGAPSRTRCIYVNLDPDSSSDTAVYSAVTNGTVLAESLFSDTGWGGHELNQQGVTILQGRLFAQNWVTLGIKSVTGSASSYGTTGDSLQSCLRVTYVGPTESDIQAIRAEPPYPLTRATDTALLVLTNLGPRSSEPFRVYVVSSGLWSNSVLVGATPVNWPTYVKLPLPVPDSTDTFVDYSLWTACANDPWAANDTTKLACWVFPPNTHAAEGFDSSRFPPTGWVVRDNDGGSQRWQRRSDDGIAHSGAGFAMCIPEPTGTSDDWLISGPVCPKKNEPDSLGFLCRVYKDDSPMYLRTWAMHGQRVADTIRSLTSELVYGGVYRRRTASLDEFDGDTIYIGFRSQSSGSWNGLCLDDVWFSGAAAPDTSAADIKVVRAEPPYPLVAGRTSKALFVLTNIGPKSSGDVWTYATAPGLAPESARAGMITIGETASVKLPLPVPRSADAMVDYTLWTAFTNDPWPDGNVKLSCWTFPANTYYAEGFESVLPSYHWSIVDNDYGGERWQRNTDETLVHSGAGFAMCAREQTGPNDDWLIGGPVCPRTDVPDSLGFFYRLYQAGSPMSLRTWAMRAPRIVDTIRSLTSELVSEAVYRRQSAPLDEFDGDTIYIGFRFQSSGSSSGLCLDDVWFSGFVTPDTSDTTDTTVTPKPTRDAVQRTVAELPDFAFASNPSRSRVVIVRSALAVRNRRVLTMRDVVGRAVRTFVLDPSGIARLDLRGLAPGVYMATLDAGTHSLTRKLVITR
jgi:hypothetical protein